MICKVCNKEFKSKMALSQHLKTHSLSSKEYYDKYLSTFGDGYCVICGNATRSLGLNGYKKTCSPKCASLIGAETRKTTLLEKYGVENISQVPEIKQKISNTVKSKECQERTKQTVNLKYGVDYVNQSTTIKNRKIYVINSELNHKHRNEWADNYEIANNCTRIGKVISQYGQGWLSIKSKIRLTTLKGYTFVNNEDLSLIAEYDKCQSKPEKELFDFVNDLCPAIFHDRQAIKPKELDIYIPNLNLAIEYNGNFWHSIENGCSEDYHLSKSLLCREHNIRLIHIYEFEDFEQQKQLIKSLILGIDNYPKNDFNKNNFLTIPEPELIHTTKRGYHIYGAGKLIGGNFLK